jgi:hypothetical protein
LGDYIDDLTKRLAYMISKDEDAFRLPLGASVDLIQRFSQTSSFTVPQEFINQLREYNSFLYRPSKHDFKLPKGRKEHRFTSREVVLTAFVTMKLARGFSNFGLEVDNDF